ncbi:hypothetical protein OS493_009471 [Desmophyllum pertusum]|uniref:Uncharacterized protein n=1 Tax=Desmophyllum pertusum TaxID=174260 RepID=A0A9W9Z4A9_9CNID|nr:hypothetical protein OS493_009471 [Desmophyllum pertusum]
MKDSENVMLTPDSASPSTEKLDSKPPVTFRKLAATPLWVWLLLALGSVLFLAGLITLIIAVTSASSKPCANINKQPGASSAEVCKYSAEANRGNLPAILKKVQTEYYALNPHDVAWQPDIELQDEHVKGKYLPYNPDPAELKRKTDRARELFQEVNSIKLDENKMKPREVKALAQVKHFLQHTFGVPYSGNYYAGDWMLGPDLFPETYDDVQLVIDTIKKHKTPIDRYRQNVQLGVKSGMIRTVIDCQAGVDALKESYRQLSLANTSEGVLNERFGKSYLNADYLANLEKGVDEKWAKDHSGKNVNASLKEALQEGVGQPLLDLINYLDHEHKSHCLPNDLASGLANLPVDYVYNNGEILAEGEKQLKFFYDQVIDIAKKYTNKSDETEAIQAFRNILNSTSMWHNNGSFPKNESDENAYKKCTSSETAAQYCPVRWKAVNKWGAVLPSSDGNALAEDHPGILFHWREDHSSKLSNRDAATLQSF